MSLNVVEEKQPSDPADVLFDSFTATPASAPTRQGWGFKKAAASGLKAEDLAERPTVPKPAKATKPEKPAKAAKPERPKKEKPAKDAKETRAATKEAKRKAKKRDLGFDADGVPLKKAPAFVWYKGKKSKPATIRAAAACVDDGPARR